MASPPYFAKGEGVNAVAEFQKFVGAVGEPAAHLLAELSWLHKRGKLSDIPPSDRAMTSVRDLCCRCVIGWAVFYATGSNPFRITVVHVASLNPHPFSFLESEAESRLRRLQL